jgi:hypothetical protein
MICKICNKEYKSFVALSQHIVQNHQITTKEYYDKYLNTSNNICPICDTKIIKFINISKGYNKTCCKKCSAILCRKELKEDSVKFEEFREKVIKNVTEYHFNMSISDKQKLRNNISIGVNKHLDTLSPEDRKRIYGYYFASKSPEEQDIIMKMMKRTHHDSNWHKEKIEKIVSQPLSLIMCKKLNKIFNISDDNILDIL